MRTRNKVLFVTGLGLLIFGFIFPAILLSSIVVLVQALLAMVFVYYILYLVTIFLWYGLS